MRLPVFDRRRAGVLLPMSALEAALGRGGRAFVDWLSEAAFSVWQILPVGPVGEDRSPYWVRSDCAGNAAFLDAAELPDPNAPIDPEFLAASGPWLHDYALFEALTGARCAAPPAAGGSETCGHSWRGWICCASIISGRWRHTGPCPPARPMRAAAPGSALRESCCCAGSWRSSATCRWSPRISGSSPRTCWR